jgi:hypothetical protein
LICVGTAQYLTVDSVLVLNARSPGSAGFTIFAKRFRSRVPWIGCTPENGTGLAYSVLVTNTLRLKSLEAREDEESTIRMDKDDRYSGRDCDLCNVHR